MVSSHGLGLHTSFLLVADFGPEVAASDHQIRSEISLPPLSQEIHLIRLDEKNGSALAHAAV